MDPVRKNNWSCQEFSSKIPKTNNSNTLVRESCRSMASDDDSNLEEERNDTLRTEKHRLKTHKINSCLAEDTLRAIIKQEMTDTIKQLVSEHIAKIAKQVTNFHESLSFLSNQYDELLRTVRKR